MSCDQKCPLTSFFFFFKCVKKHNLLISNMLSKVVNGFVRGLKNCLEVGG